MKIPDLISPIIGHRVWRWDAAGLRSLNGKRWSPRQPVAAKCGAENAHDDHEPPRLAYPKTLFLPPDAIPSDTKEMEVRLGALAAYDIDILMLGGGRKIPLCRKGSGYDTAGLVWLIGKRTEYYARRQRDRTLMKGDRVAVLGRGIAVVEHADESEVQALLVNKPILRMRRNDIVWNRQNMRWEAKVQIPKI